MKQELDCLPAIVRTLISILVKIELSHTFAQRLRSRLPDVDHGFIRKPSPPFGWLKKLGIHSATELGVPDESHYVNACTGLRDFSPPPHPGRTAKALPRRTLQRQS